jgi:hypothetical protein
MALAGELTRRTRNPADQLYVALTAARSSCTSRRLRPGFGRLRFSTGKPTSGIPNAFTVSSDPSGCSVKGSFSTSS